MNATLDILKRWQAMDRLLFNDMEGLDVEAFAEKWDLSTRQVRRDREAFEALGCLMHKEKQEEGRRHVWHYDGGEAALFVSTIRSHLIRVDKRHKEIVDALRAKIAALEAKVKSE